MKTIKPIEEFIEEGYKKVAGYKVVKRYQDHVFCGYINISCFQKENCCVVQIRFWEKEYLHEFDDKKDANRLVQSLLKGCEYEKILV